MSDARQETVADIVREMRIGDLCAEDTVARSMYINNFLASYADRIEAAWKREREAGAAAAQICGEIGEMVGREAATEKSSAVGNADIVREVAQEMLNTSMQDITAEVVYGWASRLADACKQSVTDCNQLAETLRNCDVGTAEEQAQRFKKFCYIYPLNCRGCPLKNIGSIHNDCAIFWAQMPYEQGGAK